MRRAIFINFSVKFTSKACHGSERANRAYVNKVALFNVG